jgi:RNA polymerase sigma factor (sigma-70 family)
MAYIDPTNPDFPDPIEFKGRCERVIRALMKKYRWSLIPPPEVPDFIQKICATLQQEWDPTSETEVDTLIETKAIYLYCGIWYESICDAGSLRQEVAVNELTVAIMAQLQRSVRTRDIADKYDLDFWYGVRQDILVNIFRSLHSIKDPGRFLGWINTIADRHIMRMVTRMRALPIPMEEEALEPLLTEDASSETIDLPRFRSVFEVVLDKCLRSAVRRKILWLFYMEQYTIPEIAHDLQLPLARVAEHKSRALATLRNCPYNDLLRPFLDL